MIQALDRQLNVIWALTLRETRTRFGQYQLGYLWAFVEPIVWILSFYLIFALVDRPSPRGMSLFGFLATGMITYELFSKTAEKVSLAINVNRALLFIRRCVRSISPSPDGSLRRRHIARSSW